MMTLILAKQDGSLAREWIEVGGESDTPATVSSYEQVTKETTYSSTYMDPTLSLVSEDVYAVTDVRTTTETQSEFERLAAVWKQETAHLSSLSMIAEHRAYQEVIGMGKEAIPLILRDLENAQAQWFWALRSIARESPVRPEDRGDVDAMTTAWLDWGKRRHYI